jgi:hypothetical protein
VEITPDKRKLVGMVEMAYDGRLCLPNFQRDFVWPREDVADLIRSVTRGYYIGSLLLLRCDPQNPPFAPIFLRGAKPARHEPRPELLVLDGQQRLTSLVYALTAPELPLKDSRQRRWFFMDLNVLLTDPESDNLVVDRAERELNGLDQPEVQYQERMLPCTKLFKLGEYMKWQQGLFNWITRNQPEEVDRFAEETQGRLTEFATNFHSYLVPFVELPIIPQDDARSMGRVCVIFEKLNSTGVELSVYDLLTARLYRSGINLHKLWDEACHRHRRLKDWSKGKADVNKFGVLILRTLALLRDLDPKPSILIDLKPAGFVDDWKRAAAAMERALELIEHVGPDGFGVFDKKWLPGTGLLPILAALRAEIENRDLGEGPRADLRRWYWCNVFLERYSSAVESKSRKDYTEMLGYWLKGEAEPAVFAEARARIGAKGYKVRESASHASAIYSGIFCLLALNGARDWLRGETIRLQDLHDHHIFPKAYLKRKGKTPGKARGVEVNSVVNRTLISQKTNGKIKAKAPAHYPASREVFPTGATLDLLGPHFIDEPALAALRAADEDSTPEEVARKYEAFRTAREAAILAEIRRVCGVPAPGNEA